MWISKKKYNELIERRDEFERIASNAVAQNGRLLDEWHDAIEEMKSIQELNHQLVRHNDELLAHSRGLEAEKEGLELRVDILNTDYDALDFEHVKVCRQAETLREERDHYEERCRYLEGEIEDKEELEAKLCFVIEQRDYYYNLLENTEGVHVGDVIVKEKE